MLNYKQLYIHNDFQLPQMDPVDLHPFKDYPIVLNTNPQRDAQISRIFSQKQDQSFPNTCAAYSKQFEQVTANESLYPFMVATGPNKLCLVCRDCLMIADWSANQSGQTQTGGDDLLNLTKWDKVKTPETPTAVTVGKYDVVVGYQSGKVCQYVFKTKAWEGSNEELQFPIMKIQVTAEQEGKETTVMTMDSAGNIITITFSHKTFLDKIIKTLSSAKWVSFMFRNKKRQKIKKIFKNLWERKDKEAQTQTGSSETVQPPIPYTYNSFHLKFIGGHYLLAVYRKQCLQLLVLDQQFTLINSIVISDSLKQEKQIQQVWLQLGEGGFQNANTKHDVLVVCTGTTMHFFRVIEAGEEHQVVRVCKVQTEEPLLNGKFISNNLLLVCGKDHLSICNVGDQPHQVTSFKIEKFSYLDFFIDEEGLQTDKNLLMASLLGLMEQGSNGDRCFVALEGKRLIIGSVSGWQSMLLNMVVESKWEEALHLFENVYNGTFKLCCRVNQNINQRNRDMLALCQSITKGYLQTHLSLMRVHPESPESGMVLNNFIYFMLKCDYPQLMFQQAEKTFTCPQLQGLFLAELSAYVEQSNGYNLRIPFMSQAYLNQIITKYKARHEEHILERLLMQFDLSQMQRLLLLGICLKEELYRSLISICCQQKDYITPIVKLCGISFSQPQKKATLAEIIYWYLSECLQGRMTQYGNEGDYINMLAILINFMFIPSSLEMLLAAHPQHLMEIIYMFFNPRVMQYILENQQRFFMRKDGTEQLLFEDNCLSQFKLYEKMLSVLVTVIEKSSQKEKNQYQLQLNRLLITLMLRNHFPFMAKFKIKLIHFFILHPLLFLEGQQLNPQNEVTVNGQLMRLMDSLVRSINDKCLSLRQHSSDLSTVTQLEDILKDEKQKEMNCILQKIMISPFSHQLAQTRCYIHHELGNYADVLQLYLRMNNKKTRTKVFMYLQNNLNEFSQLTQEFLKYILSLLGIDRERTIRLLWALKEGWVDHEEVIDKLVDYPDIQLGYIERIMSKGGEQSRKLLLRHLDIVLREHADHIEKFIEKIDYPLEEAFRMCQERNNRMGKACILIKSGRNMEGVMIISEIFLQSVKEYLPQLRKSNTIDENKRERILRQLDVVLQTCHKEWLVDNDRGEDIWEKNTEIVFKKLAVNNIDTPHVPEIIRVFLNEFITRILEAMLEEVSTDFFLNRFVKTFSSLPQRLFMQAYHIIHNRLQFTFTLQKLNKDLLTEEQMSLWHRLMRTIYRSHVCELKCHSCGHAITINQKMVSFSCQHILHQQCYYEQDIKKSGNQLCPLCFSPLESHLLCGDDKPLRYKLQVEEGQLLKAKMGKMKYYDRTTQRTAMEHWGKFQEWIDL